MKAAIFGCTLLLVTICSAQVKKPEDVIIPDGGCVDVDKAQKDCIAEIIFVEGTDKVEPCAAFRSTLKCFKDAGCTTDTLKSIEKQLKCVPVVKPKIDIKAEGCKNQDKARGDCVADITFLSQFDNTDVCGGFRGALYCFTSAGCATVDVNKIGKELNCSLLPAPKITINPAGCARREMATRDCIADVIFIEESDQSNMCDGFKGARSCFKNAGCTEEAMERISKDLTCPYAPPLDINIVPEGCENKEKNANDCAAELVTEELVDVLDYCRAFRIAIPCYRLAGCTTEAMNTVSKKHKCAQVEKPEINFDAEGCEKKQKAKVDCVNDITFIEGLDKTGVCDGFRKSISCFQSAGCTNDALTRIRTQLNCPIVPLDINIVPQGCENKAKNSSDCAAEVIMEEIFDDLDHCRAFKIAMPCFREAGCTTEALNKVNKDQKCAEVNKPDLQIDATGCGEKEKAEIDCGADVEFIEKFDKKDVCPALEGAKSCFTEIGKCPEDTIKAILKQKGCGAASILASMGLLLVLLFSSFFVR